ncbi:hypothetical protein J2X65_005246 [Ancylobacter sp. 3268]|uniref:cysteine rich repeat-containing protein n=1 Tax=Ancylobacter sp. 3268 TaxID=2817752 RepID=UPI00285B1F80|nr:cysteine rich repeat-containing protein [Ancylobacter sp. 3268]MDR6955863.1 hypothetical protein [Ancylobacter sp. 3268]
MKRHIFGLAALALVVSAGGASAQTMSFADAGDLIAKACGASIERFCARDDIGTGKVASCLEQNKKDVPAQCFSALQAAEAGTAARLAAQKATFGLCQDDARQFCKGVKPGDANLLDCLLASSKVVSNACRQGLANAGWAN